MEILNCPRPREASDHAPTLLRRRIVRPGFSELYLVTLQITENMYNYMIILSGFIAVTATLGLIWFIKNIVKSREARTAEG